MAEQINASSFEAIHELPVEESLSGFDHNLLESTAGTFSNSQNNNVLTSCYILHPTVDSREQLDVVYFT